MFRRTPELLKYPNLEPNQYLPFVDWPNADEIIPRLLGMVAIGFLLLCIPGIILDVGGKDDNEHPFDVPANIQQISPTVFTFKTNSNVTPSDVCWGDGDLDVSRIQVNTTIGDYRLIQCGEAQTFSPLLPKWQSMNFGDALGIIFSKWYIYPLIVLWILLWTPWLCLYKANHNRIWKNKIEKREFNARIDREEQRLREVNRAYARCDIDKEEYDVALDRAYMAGVPKAI